MRATVAALGALALLGVSAASAAPRAVGGVRHLYAVILEVTASADGTVDGVRVSRVIDPSTGSKQPVAVSVPEPYLRDARAKIAARRRAPDIQDGQPKPYFTYFYYDPDQPSEAIDHVPE